MLLAIIEYCSAYLMRSRSFMHVGSKQYAVCFVQIFPSLYQLCSFLFVWHGIVFIKNCVWPAILQEVSQLRLSFCFSASVAHVDLWCRQSLRFGFEFVPLLPYKNAIPASGGRTICNLFSGLLRLLTASGKSRQHTQEPFMSHDYLILHGINLNMFGRRDARVYGTATLDDINKALYTEAQNLGVQLDIFQTNVEGLMAERIHQALDDGTKGVVINAGAWTHYSYGLLDALDILSVPVVEVHMSHVAGRESFRHVSVIAPACCGTIAGFGINSYVLGLKALHQVVLERSV